MSALSGAGAGQPGEPRHLRRIGVTWAVATIVLLPIVIFLLGPIIPPAHASEQARDQHDINVFLTALATPVVLFVWIQFGYSVAVFRHRGEQVVDGPPLEGEPRLQVTWLVATSVIVLALAVFGTADLFSKAGVGGGQGPTPLAKPAGNDLANALEVQVIGQQWLWTFRYPSYGGLETPYLVLPVGREIAFHVTSLDVAHSFWAYELAVKADAIPGSDNVAYVKPLKVRSFQIRCAELCGLWHGHMNTTGQVLSQADFANWVARQQKAYSGATKQLPPYSHTYYPTPLRRAS